MKYKLSDKTKTVMGVTFFKIVALVDIDVYAIKAGDEGGWVEKIENLDQSGNAWVSGDAHVYGNAWVYGDARVYGNARVYGDARVSGDAQVYGNARVYSNAQVYGNARVYSNARVSGDAWVYGDASKSPIAISGLNWHVTIIDTKMVIGCQEHDISAWEKFTDSEIAEMSGNALEFWNKNKAAIMTLANNHKVN